MEERLQKILARAGYGSRRASELLIANGRVTVNGNTAILGTRADQDVDQIKVDGQLLDLSKHENIYIALHKPRNVLSDNDPRDDRTTVRDLVPVRGHLFTVGRLDYESEGLILLTNDGELANRLTHPRYGHEKEYKVMVVGQPDEKQLAIWRRGVVMKDGSRSLPAIVEVVSTTGEKSWLKIILKEGKKRQIREIGSLIGLPVERIVRVRIGTLLLGELKTGEWRNLRMNEVKSLKDYTAKAPLNRTKSEKVPAPRIKTEKTVTQKKRSSR